MEMKEYLIDSDILIDYLRGVKKAYNFLLRENFKGKLWISVINVMEIYSGKDTKSPKKEKIINEFLNSFKIILINKEIAIKAGKIRREYQKPFADVIIAASALVYNLLLITRNKKHFVGIKNLKVISPY